ncbi:hypothetical protein EST38_g12624 [Candolleomyces aberdarensis]|uniref:RhoGAP-domain-containing protein n=1 Tax=Candolleomyces aberdarensis TaxID=2316362 RepID=A0A4Q2D3Z5_9AGAR|nr:hypothetical protein EST38_g12624 [Candolleomyces aberdarensis]
MATLAATHNGHQLPLREQSHLDLHNHTDPADSADPADERLCPGCKLSAVNEQGGLVVAFGQSFFHVDCFKCAKCRNQVTADTNLLLLSDGSPICANCSYSCNVCKQPILDEAIMAGDDSYHAHCFKCKVCKNRIDELVFAKTSNGIYCMKCHNERMIKIRKHSQKKAERERAQGGSGSSKSRERVARDYHRENTVRPPPLTAQCQYLSCRQAPPSPAYDASTHGSAKPAASQPYNDSLRRQTDKSQPPSRSNTIPSATTLANDASPAPISNGYKGGSVNVAPADASSVGDRAVPSKQQTLPVPGQLGKGASRRSVSYDDGLKPPEESNAPSSSELGYSLSSNTTTLSVTPRQQKRRSINPGLKISPFSETVSTTVQSTQSPRSETFPNNSPAPPSYTDARSSSPPTTDQQSSNTRRTSHANSLHSIHSLSSNHDPSRSPSPSITTQDYDAQDETVILKSPVDQSFRQPNSVPNPGGPHGERISAGLSPADPAATFRAQQRISSLSIESRHSGSRSASPAYRADVPHNVESGTDTEPEGDEKLSSRNSLPPAPPPKDKATLSRSSSSRNGHAAELESTSQKDDYSDFESSSPVERVQTSTFIAPALPPIRFSLNTSEFSELLSSVNNNPLSELANLQKQALEDSSSPTSGNGDDDSSPPSTPTATSANGHGSSSGHSDPASHQPNGSPSAKTHVTITPTVAVPRRSPDAVTARLREAVEDARDRSAQHVKLDRTFLEAILDTLEGKTSEYNQMKTKLDGMRRASKQYIEGLTVAQTEYDRELKSRRDAEAEVTRLRVLLSGQAARLTALSGDTKRQEVRQQMTKELHDSLSGLEQDLSRLKTERDMAVAEMEELSATKTSGGSPGENAPAALSRSLTKRLDGIRNQYSRDLIPLQQQREQLSREITELKAVRDVFLEETAALNARNEELAQLGAVYSRRMDTIPETPQRMEKSRQPSVTQGIALAPTLTMSTSSSSTVYEDTGSHMKVPTSNQEMHTPAKNKFKWPGSKVKEMVSPPATTNGAGVEFSKGKAHIEHNFQQLSVLRFTRCDHCGDKMWGSQLKCTVCSTSIHVRCIANVHIPCAQTQSMVVKDNTPPGPLPPSMFGRDLTEQVRADARDDDRRIPVIVEKCIDAVEESALDYEGIYRKTGGLTQTKAITQLFESGNYSSFDLLDSDRFNDICSVTSVLKNYFRSLPVPLLTFDLHDQFIASVSIRDQALKNQTLTDLVHDLPDEHYFTLMKLMVHLHHVRLRCEKNRMTSRNLGVVFGPTLMRSRDPGAEFSDMAGKALFIEWLIDSAPEVFKDES